MRKLEIYDQLPSLLKSDWNELRIFNEGDMHSCAYYWIRKYYEKHSTAWTVRNKATAAGGAWFPDIAVYYNGTLRDIVEFKFIVGSNSWQQRVDSDRKKIETCKRQSPELRHAYQIYMYSAPEDLRKSPRVEWMKRYYSEVGVNVRTGPGGRTSPGFESRYKKWAKLRERMVRTEDAP